MSVENAIQIFIEVIVVKEDSKHHFCIIGGSRRSSENLEQVFLDVQTTARAINFWNNTMSTTFERDSNSFYLHYSTCLPLASRYGADNLGSPPLPPPSPPPMISIAGPPQGQSLCLKLLLLKGSLIILPTRNMALLTFKKLDIRITGTIPSQSYNGRYKGYPGFIVMITRPLSVT